MRKHNHKCIVCKKVKVCDTTTKQGYGQGVCEGDYDDFCNKCGISKKAIKYMIEHNMIDDLEVTIKNYGKQNFDILIQEGYVL